jgi:hypothetical protein
MRGAGRRDTRERPPIGHGEVEIEIDVEVEVEGWREEEVV